MRDKPNRPLCPFYGFANVLTDQFILVNVGAQLSNQCPLVTDAHAACGMEMDGDVPNWNHCQYFNNPLYAGVVSGFRRRGQVFPMEYKPEGAVEWHGIPFSVWERHIMENEDIAA